MKTLNEHLRKLIEQLTKLVKLQEGSKPDWLTIIGLVCFMAGAIFAMPTGNFLVAAVVGVGFVALVLGTYLVGSFIGGGQELAVMASVVVVFILALVLSASVGQALTEAWVLSWIFTAMGGAVLGVGIISRDWVSFGKRPLW